MVGECRVFTWLKICGSSLGLHGFLWVFRSGRGMVEPWKWAIKYDCQFEMNKSWRKWDKAEGSDANKNIDKAEGSDANKNTNKGSTGV